jgi:hypothetical protein
MSKGKSKTPAKAEPGNKKERVLALLRREGGASLSEIVEASGWQAHSARAVLTGYRKSGITIDKTKVEGVTRYTALEKADA